MGITITTRIPSEPNKFILELVLLTCAPTGCGTASRIPRWCCRATFFFFGIDAQVITWSRSIRYLIWCTIVRFRVALPPPTSVIIKSCCCLCGNTAHSCRSTQNYNVRVEAYTCTYFIITLGTTTALWENTRLVHPAYISPVVFAFHVAQMLSFLWGLKD